MKKTVNPKSGGMDELRPEYRFEYQKAKANRFADQAEEDRVVVVLDPGAAKVFRTPDSVNQILRALIKTMPATAKRKAGSA